MPFVRRSGDDNLFLTDNLWGTVDSLAGTVVGCYNTNNDAAIGFTYSKDTFSDFALPGISGALPTAVSTTGIVAGYYDQNSQPWGFTLKGTKVATFQEAGPRL
jgi:hypothetical protein